jgi:hypothetical protein
MSCLPRAGGAVYFGPSTVTTVVTGTVEDDDLSCPYAGKRLAVIAAKTKRLEEK